MAPAAVAEALSADDGLALQGYDARLHATYGLYYKVARAFVRLIGRPELMRVLVSTGMHSRTLMEWVLRIMANLLRPDELGPAEAAYRALAALARPPPPPAPPPGRARGSPAPAWASTVAASWAASAVRARSASVWARLGKAIS